MRDGLTTEYNEGTREKSHGNMMEEREEVTDEEKEDCYVVVMVRKTKQQQTFGPYGQETVETLKQEGRGR